MKSIRCCGCNTDQNHRSPMKRHHTQWLCINDCSQSSLPHCSSENPQLRSSLSSVISHMPLCSTTASRLWEIFSSETRQTGDLLRQREFFGGGEIILYKTGIFVRLTTLSLAYAWQVMSRLLRFDEWWCAQSAHWFATTVSLSQPTWKVSFELKYCNVWRATELLCSAFSKPEGIGLSWKQFMTQWRSAA